MTRVDTSAYWLPPVKPVVFKAASSLATAACAGFAVNTVASGSKVTMSTKDKNELMKERNREGESVMPDNPLTTYMCVAGAAEVQHSLF